MAEISPITEKGKIVKIGIVSRDITREVKKKSEADMSADMSAANVLSGVEDSANDAAQALKPAVSKNDDGSNKPGNGQNFVPGHKVSFKFDTVCAYCFLPEFSKSANVAAIPLRSPGMSVACTGAATSMY